MSAPPPSSFEPCATCGFRMGEPLARLTASDLCFVSDARFPGRCVVVLHRHATELYELTPAQRHAFADDVSTAARAIMAAVGAFKMNYEVLGNADPHVHCHLIPRQLEEPKPKAPAWLHPEPQAGMEPAAAEAIRRRIAAQLDALPDA
jgi:diadenosine tetraphosphate (Ap4A) HIT family hydrolase